MEHQRILITGGGGFIGSHLADKLISRDCQVRVLDSLSSQVHGEGGGRPSYLSKEVELVEGDVLDYEMVRHALQDVDAVYHFAAKVGVGQSMYEIVDYTRVNNLGTAVLMEELVRARVKRLVVASSMSIYGEGLYQDCHGKKFSGASRSLEHLKCRQWDPEDEHGCPLVPVPTPETKMPSLASIYALSKFDQERMCLILGKAYDIPTVALRFFNVYGTRQALSNPYTGVLAIFASRLLNNLPPQIFEDGHQMRDFVNIDDITEACCLALERTDVSDEVFNIGSGEAISIRDVALKLGRIIGKDHIKPVITGKYRVGDIRHCFADVGHAWERLGYRPRVSFEQGLGELAEWLREQPVVKSSADASAELAERGLAV
jgi:dTDP-L-rhamnose 4-epimerase